jgi:hypothetical protein
MEYVVVGILALNTLLLIGIAGSIAKLIRYTQGDDSSSGEWSEIIRSRRALNTRVREPNYTETLPIAPLDDRSPNWDGLPRENRNWDGIPRQNS